MFPDDNSTDTPTPLKDYSGINGLCFRERFLDEDAQSHILQEIDSRPWLGDLKRRVQHYGYKYDYTSRSVNPSMRVGPLPPFALEVVLALQGYGLIEQTPDQMIVNEYQAGQGISAHVDCVPCFKDTIVTVSLGWVYEMDFIHLETKDVRSILLERGSALVMQGEARYAWAHRIQARKSDHGIPRNRRVSLTFRNVILDSE